MSQLLVSFLHQWLNIIPRERRMTSARTNTLAALRGSIERIETYADGIAPGRVALDMRTRMRPCRVASHRRGAPRCSPRDGRALWRRGSL